MNIFKFSFLLLIFIEVTSLNVANAFSNNASKKSTASRQSYGRVTSPRSIYRKVPTASPAAKPIKPITNRRYTGGSASCRNPQNTMQCMICNCWHEAGNQDTRGKIEVNRTVIARVNSALYPSTACGVIYQNKQFSWANTMSGRRPVTGRSYLACKEAVDHSLKEGSNGACHYHAYYVRPKWAKRLRISHRHQAHIFYKGGCGRRGRSGGPAGTPMRVQSSIQLEQHTYSQLITSLYEGA